MTSENKIQIYLKAPPKDIVSLIYLKVDTKVHTKTMILVGIEIPDYVSSPNKGTLLKTIQNRYMHKFKHDELYKEFCRMMAAGK